MTSVSVAAVPSDDTEQQRRTRTFRLALLAVFLVALAIRVVYVLGWHNPANIGGDAYYYHNGANIFADGQGFPHPYPYVQDGVVTPGAQHPPLYIVVLGLGSVLGLRSVLAHQILSCLLGALTVAVIGLTGRRLAGRRTGLLAAGLAAVYPNFWLNDALLMSETLVQLTVAATVLAGYVFWERRTLPRAAVLGLLVGLATLTRAEGPLLAVALVAPLCLVAAGVTWRRRLALLGVAALVCIVTLAPWVGYNLSRFERPVLISTGLEPTLVVTNCDDTYSGAFYGYWSYQCYARLPPAPGADDSVRAETYRRIGVDYIKEHRGEVPGVVLARIGRTWGLYRPGQEIALDTIERRELPVSRVGLSMFYGLAIASVMGAVQLRRRRVPLAPLLATLLMSTFAAALAGGLTRYRAAAEVGLVLLAAVGFAVLLQHLLARRRVAQERGGSPP